MSNTINTTIIQNPQATVNTSVQASVLNGGYLAQMFNLQAMRIVKGRVVAGTTASTNYSVINEYDGSPVTLGPSDFIVAFAVSNGNTSNAGATPTVTVPPTTPYSPLLLTPSGAAVQFALNTVPPTFNVVTNTWTPTGDGVGVTPVLTAGAAGSTGALINMGYGEFLAGVAGALQTSCGALSWLQANVGTTAFTNTAGYINIVLLVLTGFPAQ
jgi:hypothetical protein